MKETLTKAELLEMGPIVFVEGDSQLHDCIKDLYDDFVEMGIPCEKVENIYEPEQQAKLLGMNPKTLVVQSVFVRDETAVLFNKIVSAQQAGILNIKNIISLFDSGQLLGACNQFGGTYIEIGFKIDDETFDLNFNTIGEE